MPHNYKKYKEIRCKWLIYIYNILCKYFIIVKKKKLKLDNLDLDNPNY